MHAPLWFLPLLLVGLQQPASTPKGSLPKPPPNPILSVLDANGDGMIDAVELAKAAASLKKLDANQDRRLTPEEYRPPRPDGSMPKARPAGVKKPHPEERPRPPLDVALDLNGDEIIDAEEQAKAPTSLKKLDRNGDGKLTPDEFRRAPTEESKRSRPTEPTRP